MTTIQQPLFVGSYGPDPAGWNMALPNSQFGSGTSQSNSADDLSNSPFTQMPIPNWYWSSSGGTNNVLGSGGFRDGVLIPDFRYTNASTGRIFAMNSSPKGSNSGNNTYQNTYSEMAGMISTDGGDTYTQSGISMPTQTIQNFSGSDATANDWATNGDAANPIWIIVAGFYPYNDTNQSGSSNLQIYRSTNLTTWTRVVVPADRTNFASAPSHRINQFIQGITWSVDRFVIYEGRSGAVAWSSTGLANSWSSWYMPTSGTAYWNGGGQTWESIHSNNGGSKILLVNRASSGNSPHIRSFYSSDKGQTWTSGAVIGSDNSYYRWNHINYFDGTVNVGNTSVGPGVWVVTGGRYGLGYQGRFNYEELIAYSTNGTSWTEIDVQNDMTPAELYQGNYGKFSKIVDTGRGKFIMTKGSYGTPNNYSTYQQKWYMSNNSLTDWTKFSDTPWTGTDGSTNNTGGLSHEAQKAWFFYNDRIYVGGGDGAGGAVMQDCYGRVAYHKFL